LGLYAVDPVSATYVFGSPVLDRAEIALGGDRKLVIRTFNNAADRPYIQSVSWNGKPWTKSWISHAELAAGGVLEFHMSDKPNTQFGQKREDRPPSFGMAASDVVAIDAG
jgi:putative alpha-1,2-mannosidase